MSAEAQERRWSTGAVAAALCAPLPGDLLMSAPERPPAVGRGNEAGRSPVVLICEHASNSFRRAMRRSACARAELARHIAWDIGAAALARLSRRRSMRRSSSHGYSRLLIDLNRPLRVPDSIPPRSEDDRHPGQPRTSIVTIGAARAGAARALPRRASRRSSTRAQRGRPTLLVAIHSFTPVFLGGTAHGDAGHPLRRGRRFRAGGQPQDLAREPGSRSATRHLTASPARATTPCRCMAMAGAFPRSCSRSATICSAMRPPRRAGGPAAAALQRCGA